MEECEHGWVGLGRRGIRGSRVLEFSRREIMGGPFKLSSTFKHGYGYYVTLLLLLLHPSYTKQGR